jgi:hypothetical protein
LDQILLSNSLLADKVRNSETKKSSKFFKPTASKRVVGSRRCRAAIFILRIFTPNNKRDFKRTAMRVLEEARAAGFLCWMRWDVIGDTDVTGVQGLFGANGECVMLRSLADWYDVKAR